MLETYRLRLHGRIMRLTGGYEKKQKQADRDFERALSLLKAGDLAIDLGANTGLYTRRLAETGADVIAFEPDPVALEMLRRNLADCANVTIVPKAAGARAATLQLLRHPGFSTAPLDHSIATTVVEGSRDGSVSTGIAVEVVDFVDYLKGLDREVAVLKVDIEGAEVELLEKILDGAVSRNISRIFVETHEWLFIDLAARTRALKRRTRRLNRPKINWDWR